MQFSRSTVSVSIEVECVVGLLVGLSVDCSVCASYLYVWPFRFNLDSYSPVLYIEAASSIISNQSKH